MKRRYSSVAAYIEREGKVFLAQRYNQGDMALRWELPGGKIEEDEPDEQALKREFQEEFHAKLSVNHYLCKTNFKHREKNYEVRLYAAQIEGEPSLGEEHVDFDWIDQDRIMDFNLVDSDRSLLDRLSQQEDDTVPESSEI